MKKALSLILALLMSVSVLAGCKKDNNNTPVGDGKPANTKKITADELAVNVRGYDYEESDFVFDKPFHDVVKTQPIEWKIDFNPEEKGFDDLNELVNVYYDSDFTVPVRAQVSYDASIGALVIAPPYISSFSPFDNMRHNDWGHGNQYFAVRYYSIEGELLDKPVVTVFTIKNDLEAPYVSFNVKDGFASYSWEPVAGADSYELYLVNKRFSDVYGYYSYFEMRFAETTETSIVHEDISESFGTYIIHNLFFRLSEDEDDAEYFVAAVAKNGDTTSQFGNSIYDRDIAPILPFAVSPNGDDDNDTTMHSNDINQLGVFRWIDMCDRSLIKMPITYHIDQVEVVDLHSVASSQFSPGERFGMYIPYTVYNIGMSGFSIVGDYDYPEFEDDLQRLKDREIDEYKAGSVAPKVERFTKDDVMPDGEVSLTIGEFQVNASNALVEYLAVHMLNGAEYVDVSMLNEASDIDYLLAAWQEAYYQNPMIMMVNSINWSYAGDLFITYGQSREEQARKQAELQAEVRRVVSTVITDDMTDLEKQLALNNYLIDTAEYDFACLEAAARNNYEFFDSSFNDSFTAYGVLINKIGVCASYAAAFKLLADEAGLPAIVVNGYMYGTLPHAWNRVLIGNEWLTMDSTNNDDGGADMFYNIYFNLPDSVVGTIFVEGTEYSMSRDAYRGNSYQYEYYRIEGLFFDESAIAAELVRGLNEDGFVRLRTSYDLSEERFRAIINEVVRLGGFYNLEGGTFLGVIYLEVA